MKFKYNDKFSIIGADFNCEIIGCFPGGQQRTVQVRENSYRVLLNGVAIDISEDNLNVLVNAGKPQAVPEMHASPLAKDTDLSEKPAEPTPQPDSTITGPVTLTSPHLEETQKAEARREARRKRKEAKADE